jgi:hypothetical protein
MIHGEGLLFGRIVNYGTILADRDGSDLEISDPGSKENYGALVATSGGQLLIEDDIVGTGRLLAQGGTIQVSGGVLVVCDDIDVPPGSVSHLDIGVNPAGPAIVNAATLNIAGGIVTVNNGSTVNVTGAVTICPAVSPPGSVAELHVNQSTLNAGSLDICSGGVFTVASTISVGESFINAMTDGTSTPAPAHWSWAPGSDLVFTGGQAANMQPFVLDGWAILEVASADIGPTGGTNDFKLADLILATGTHVSLVDFKENHLPPVASEADYCDSLTLSSGAVLNLNGNALYVAGVPVAVGPFGGGLIVDEPRGIVGDCSGDGDLTYDDVTCFIDALLGVDLELSHQLAADLNRDGSTDGRDIRQFIEVVLSS